MLRTVRTRAIAAALTAIALSGGPNAARADAKDYEFQAISQSIVTGPDAVLAVRLVNKATGKPVPNAVIFATRLDMTPEGMSEMAAKLTPLPEAEPGTYKFKSNVSMAGDWQLSLAAKVQGETGTVEGKLVVKAQK